MDRRVHALLLTFPAQGHINPMMQLACNLIVRGCSVTVVDTQRCHSNVLSATQRDPQASANLIEKDASPEPKEAPFTPGIRYLTISDGLPDSFKLDSSPECLKMVLDGMKQQRGVLEKYIESSKASDDPVSCLVADFFYPWAMDLAANVGIPGAFCFTSNVTTAMIFAFGPTDEADERDELLKLHNFCMPKDKLLTFLERPQDPAGVEFRQELKDSFFKASQILVNSVQELEDFVELPEALAKKMRFVGPLLPAEVVEAKASGGVCSQTSIFQEKLEYTRWLDEQVQSSVLFISFGSVVHLPPAQLVEIAAGIEESGVKFLWVARPDKEGKTHLPDDFEERTKDRGRVIPWAEQLAVLAHPATGGFLTHCGWNSVLESISLGVPMLCQPSFADQPLNKALIVEQWKVGLPLQNNEGEVTKDSVKNGARELMDGMEGKPIRAHVTQWQEAAAKAIRKDGSSYKGLSEFMSYIRSHH